MSLLSKLRAILVALKLFYWYAFKGSMKALFQRNISFSHQYWAQYCCEYFQIKKHKLANSKELKKQKGVLLTNHRTQADFFVHSMLAQHQANFLSRLLVGIIFFLFPIFSSESLWLFNRSGNVNPQKFNEWLDYKFSKSRKPLLLAYPEGHRMGAASAVNKEKIKSGIIRYAYRRSLPVQMMMAFGNERVFNEKKLSVEFGVNVYYCYSDSIDPRDFANEDDFVNKIKDEFVKFFDESYRLYPEAEKKNQ